MEFDESDLKTDSFSNAQGWTLVRVTHLPSSISVERSRDETRSAAQAQRDCIEELRTAVTHGEQLPTDESADGPVTRAEFDILLARVARLEKEIGGSAYSS